MSIHEFAAVVNKNLAPGILAELYRQVMDPEVSDSGLLNLRTYIEMISKEGYTLQPFTRYDKVYRAMENVVAYKVDGDMRTEIEIPDLGKNHVRLSIPYEGEIKEVEIYGRMRTVEPEVDLVEGEAPLFKVTASYITAEGIFIVRTSGIPKESLSEWIISGESALYERIEGEDED